MKSCEKPAVKTYSIDQFKKKPIFKPHRNEKNNNIVRRINEGKAMKISFTNTKTLVAKTIEDTKTILKTTNLSILLAIIPQASEH